MIGRYKGREERCVATTITFAGIYYKSWATFYLQINFLSKLLLLFITSIRLKASSIRTIGIVGMELLCF